LASTLGIPVNKIDRARTDKNLAFIAFGKGNPSN
jgi:hypothetical protein